jgi:16S rRNA (guanine1516-N2)-methyltransferase
VSPRLQRLSESQAPRVAVALLEGGDARRASELAERLGLPLAQAATQPAGDPDTLWLCAADGRLELRSPARRHGAIRAELAEGLFDRRRRRAGVRSEPLARAAGLGKGPPPRVLDATAGLGRDAALLAWLGCEVTAVERHPVVAALLADALERAAQRPELAAAFQGRLRLIVGDARDVLAAARGDAAPDVVLLDPMYPVARRSALARKELQALRQLVGDDEDADALLQPALAAARRRVVVKRHAHAPPLAGRAPDLRLPGASTRFDVYLARPA